MLTLKKKLTMVPKVVAKPEVETNGKSDKPKVINKALEKARAARKAVKIRAYLASPAGHCEDRLRRIAKFLQKVYVRTSGWSIKDGVAQAEEQAAKILRIDQALTEAGSQITTAIEELKQLAVADFKPKLRARGMKKLEVTPGMRVWLKPEAYEALLIEKAYTPEQLDKLILSRHSTNNEKLLFVRVEKNEPGYPSLGYIHRKNLTALRPDYSDIGVVEAEHEEAPDVAPEASKTA